MKLAAYRGVDDPMGTRRVGLVVGDRRAWWVHPLGEDADLLRLLEGARTVREAAADVAAQDDGLRMDQVVLLPPIDPIGMWGVDRNDGPGSGERGVPTYVVATPAALTGPFGDVAAPPGTMRLDVEPGLAAIICCDVHEPRAGGAGAAIGGYCVIATWVAGDVEDRDVATIIGPWVVTPDELEEFRDPGGRLDLEMTIRVNGVQVRADVPGQVDPTIERLLSHASQLSSLQAGELVAVPTCRYPGPGGRHNSAAAAPLQVGDVVEVAVGRLGAIRSTIVPRVRSGPGADRSRTTRAGSP